MDVPALSRLIQTAVNVFVCRMGGVLLVQSLLRLGSCLLCWILGVSQN